MVRIPATFTVLDGANKADKARAFSSVGGPSKTQYH